MDPLGVLDLARTDLDGRVAAIGDDQWELPTPCEGWDVRELLNHVVAGSAMATLLLDGATRDEAAAVWTTDNLGDDPKGAYQTAMDAQLAAFRDNPDPARILPHPAMDLPASMLLEFRVSDLLVHGWDLSRAIGVDEDLDPRVVEEVWVRIQPMIPMLPSTGMFGEGPSGAVPDGAPLQVRLLDAMGRRP